MKFCLMLNYNISTNNRDTTFNVHTAIYKEFLI